VPWIDGAAGTYAAQPGEGPVLVADDADVAVIAAFRFALRGHEIIWRRGWRFYSFQGYFAMQNGRKTSRHFKPSPPSRSKRWTSNARPSVNVLASAQRSYERYLALAQEEARSGNVVGAENYYQRAEHYYRSMSRGGLSR
jgi:Domain of unknown function (DUF4167)